MKRRIGGQGLLGRLLGAALVTPMMEALAGAGSGGGGSAPAVTCPLPTEAPVGFEGVGILDNFVVRRLP
jgi:hypothetical protein